MFLPLLGARRMGLTAASVTASSQRRSSYSRKRLISSTGTVPLFDCSPVGSNGASKAIKLNGAPCSTS
jgi:hypothetical protein